MSTTFLILLASVIANVNSQYVNFQDFVDMVQGNITAARNYKFPQNNANLVSTTEETVFGKL